MAQGSLRLGRFGDIAVTFLQLQGNRGAGVDRLDLALELLPLNWDLLQDARLIMWADLEVAPESVGRLAVGNIGPGVAAFAGGGRTFPARMDLRAILGRQQIEAIETARDGGPISLCLRTHGMVFPGIVEGKETSAPETFWHDLEFRLKPAEWVEVLEAWGYAQGFLIQVPVISDPLSIAAVQASKDLQRAVSEMTGGRYREAVAACRDALESAYGASDKDRYPELRYSVPGIKQVGKAERFWILRRGAWAVANAAKHSDEQTRDIEWVRSDAQALILSVSALLQQDPPVGRGSTG